MRIKVLAIALLILAAGFAVQAQTVKGRSATVYVEIGEDELPTIEPKLPKIYAVVIGVSQYQQPELNLQFADDDAKLYYDFLKSPQGGALPDDRITLLLNEKATRANIIKALNTQFKNSFDDDLVIVYIASHGMPSAETDKLYFLGADTDKHNLEGTGIAQTDIIDAIRKCRAQKKIWIADACHSGAIRMDAAIAGLRGTQEAAQASMVNRLLKSVATAQNGMVVLTASSSSEPSQEGERWGGGHGVFTHYLVDGLKGAADENKNGIVDVREVFEYVRIKVSNDTDRKQYPDLNNPIRMPMSVLRATK